MNTGGDGAPKMSVRLRKMGAALHPGHMRAHRVLAVVLAAAFLALLAVVTTPPAATPLSGAASSVEPTARPNIVVVLMDDASFDLLPTMAAAQDMAAQGADYTSAYVVDSLCCVSRTTILTGQYPHQTGVLTNVAGSRSRPRGGWSAFTKYGNDDRAVNVRLHNNGYTTGFVGKFLNGFAAAGGVRTGPPPGWSEFLPVFESAYDGWDFTWAHSIDGAPYTQHHQGAPPASASPQRKDAAYAGTFIQQRALGFLDDHAGDSAPYFLEVAVYATHSKTTGKSAYPHEHRFPAMFRDQRSKARPTGNCGAVSCEDLSSADLLGYGDPRADNRPVRASGKPGPVWQRHSKLKADKASALLRDQARMAQSVDRMLQRILATVDDNTYVILTSDNGIHTGQWGLILGKGSAYGSDVHVPLVITGPGVTPGTRLGFVSNLDLAPTLEELAGMPPASYRSGVSFADSLTDPTEADRRYVYTEHTWSGRGGFDPDAGNTELITIPTYLAARSAEGLLIRYDYDTRPGRSSYAYELYDLTKGVGERTNVYGRPEVAALQHELEAKLAEFRACAPQRRDADVPQTCRDITR